MGKKILHGSQVLVNSTCSEPWLGDVVYTTASTIGVRSIGGMSTRDIPRDRVERFDRPETFRTRLVRAARRCVVPLILAGAAAGMVYLACGPVAVDFTIPAWCLAAIIGFLVCMGLEAIL